MSDFDQLNNTFMMLLSQKFSISKVETISNLLIRAAYDYDIEKKKTEIVPYTNDLPRIVKEYLVCKKIEGLSDETIYAYKNALTLFFETMQKNPEAIEKNDILLYLHNYKTYREVSDRTLDKYREYICRFFTWASSEGYIPTNPSNNIKPIKHQIKPRTALTQIELEKLRSACINDREKAYIEVLYSTGCRISELSILEKSDVDFVNKTVHLFGKGKKHRTSYLNAKAEVALKRYLDGRTDDSEYLFVTSVSPHKQMTKRSLESMMTKISNRADIGKTVTPHIIRHTTATQAVRSGVMPIESISKLLGHSSISTTMIYAEVSDDKVFSEHCRAIV